MKRLVILLSFTLPFFCFSAQAQSSSTTTPTNSSKVGRSLDGKTFYIKTYDVANPSKIENDTLKFKNGKMMSSGCMQYGFKGASYQVSMQNGKAYFTSDFTSSKQGKISWNGYVDGNNINGKYLWHKEGQKDINYSFSGSTM